jgi:hypothetical protein
MLEIFKHKGRFKVLFNEHHYGRDGNPKIPFKGMPLMTYFLPVDILTVLPSSNNATGW